MQVKYFKHIELNKIKILFKISFSICTQYSKVDRLLFSFGLLHNVRITISAHFK